MSGLHRQSEKCEPPARKRLQEKSAKICELLAAHSTDLYQIGGRKTVLLTAKLAGEREVMILRDHAVELFLADQHQSSFNPVFIAVAIKLYRHPVRDLYVKAFEYLRQNIFRCHFILQHLRNIADVLQVVFQPVQHRIFSAGHQLNEESACAADASVKINKNTESYRGGNLLGLYKIMRQVIRNFPGAVSRARRFMTLWDSPERFARLALNAALTEFIADLANYLEGMRHQPRSVVAARIADYIEAHISERLTCRRIADAFSYHPSYVSRIIREYQGCSLHDYIIRVKIDAATKLLLESEMTITDIAYYLSFYDSSHFTKTYFDITGRNPSDVRRKIL